MACVTRMGFDFEINPNCSSQQLKLWCDWDRYFHVALRGTLVSFKLSSNPTSS
uniref:Uncharacterized protein n=1 Tax=Rhizophora mucronata TaxID=61149 RepID=A0A2P2QJA9_RHIMU